MSDRVEAVWDWFESLSKEEKKIAMEKIIEKAKENIEKYEKYHI